MGAFCRLVLSAISRNELMQIPVTYFNHRAEGPLIHPYVRGQLSAVTYVPETRTVTPLGNTVKTNSSQFVSRRTFPDLWSLRQTQRLHVIAC